MPWAFRVMPLAPVAFVVVMLWAIGAGAQEAPGTVDSGEWNADRYLELLDEGDRLYQEALLLRETDEDGYKERLYQCLQLKQEALEMLRRASLRGGDSARCSCARSAARHRSRCAQWSLRAPAAGEPRSDGAWRQYYRADRGCAGLRCESLQWAVDRYRPASGHGTSYVKRAR